MRGSTKIPREKKKRKHETGEIKHIRGLLKSGPHCLSIIRLVGEIHASTVDSSASSLSGSNASETRYLRLIGNSASLSFGISFPRENYHPL